MERAEGRNQIGSGLFKHFGGFFIHEGAVLDSRDTEAYQFFHEARSVGVSRDRNPEFSGGIENRFKFRII